MKQIGATEKPAENTDVCDTNYNNLPTMDLSDVPSEFKNIADHFEGLRKKYCFTAQN